MSGHRMQWGIIVEGFINMSSVEVNHNPVL